jgi:hypothetical protein
MSYQFISRVGTLFRYSLQVIGASPSTGSATRDTPELRTELVMRRRSKPQPKTTRHLDPAGIDIARDRSLPDL